MEMRNSYNAVRSFNLVDGIIITDPIAMSNLSITHFQSILSPADLEPLSITMDWFQNLSDFKCNSTLVRSLCNVPTQEEITKALMKLNPNKAPGPYGLTSGFFKAAWNTVGSELIEVISNFFVTGFLPLSTNETILALVPKSPGASAVSDYRHVSCCNTVYKVISKLLVHRLKPLLPDFIVPNQTAFVKGRLLVENTVLASKIVQGYHKDKNPRRIAIKVDVAEVFDTVCWEFILCLLRGIGVPELYLRWLKVCICNIVFSIGYNGMIHGYFKRKRGLRQGDPLSPYLFERN